MHIPTVASIALLFVSSLAGQTLQQATPVDQLLKEIHTHAHHHLVAEMDAVPVTAPDGFNAAAAKAFTIVAHQFDFTVTPSPFVVNQGDSVTLDITSSDVTHGFFLDHYMTNDVSMAKNQHRTVTFVATTPGIFVYACTVSSCGVGHSDMNGEMMVVAAAAAPTISSFTPTSGPVAGGTVVAITGTNFQNGASVKFGDAPAVSTTVNGSTNISAIAPAHAAGDVAITVTNPDGNSATFGTYSYVAPLAITSITPSIGTTAGGTQVTINGTGFTSAATVTFGGVAGTSVNVVSATTLTVIAPAHAAGAVDVIVKVGSSQVTAANGFTYATPGQKRRAVRQQ